MNSYSNDKICPSCGMDILPSDNIAICSDCGTMQHEECWNKNGGCTTNSCQGVNKLKSEQDTVDNIKEITSEDSKEKLSETIIYCTRCGTQNNSDFSFCTKCGNKLVTYTDFSKEDFNAQTNPVNYNSFESSNYQENAYNNSSYNTYNIDNDIKLLIGENSDYYISKFQEMRLNNKKTSINWAALLFGPFWFIYRKMYGIGASILLAQLTWNSLGPSVYFSLVILAVYIFIGLYGNSFYMKLIEEKTDKVKTTEEPFKSQFIVQNGGVNTMATILAVIGYFVLTLLI